MFDPPGSLSHTVRIVDVFGHCDFHLSLHTTRQCTQPKPIDTALSFHTSGDRYDIVNGLCTQSNREEKEQNRNTKNKTERTKHCTKKNKASGESPLQRLRNRTFDATEISIKKRIEETKHIKKRNICMNITQQRNATAHPITCHWVFRFQEFGFICRVAQITNDNRGTSLASLYRAIGS